MVDVLRSRMAWAACKSSSPCVRSCKGAAAAFVTDDDDAGDVVVLVVLLLLADEECRSSSEYGR